MPKVRIDDVFVEEIDDEFDDENLVDGIEKFSRVQRTKMRDDLARYKNKKKNKGRERQKTK